jgi:hypothetical protein
MGLSELYGEPTQESEAIDLLHQAVDLGITHFDRAEIYGQGHNEQLLGKAFAGRRDQSEYPAAGKNRWVSTRIRRQLKTATPAAIYDTSGWVAGMPNIVTRNANLILPQRHLARLAGRPTLDRQ